MEQDKDLLRTWLKRKRLTMPEAEYKRLSDAISRRFIEEVNWENIKSVHCYTTILSLKEVDTASIFEFIYTKHPDIKVFQQGKDTLLPMKQWSFDLVVVPTLGFDLRRNRVGWGGGFFDRFLASQPKALKVGLAYESGFVKAGLPVEPYDISLDIIITEKRILKNRP
jgi:5-formyltetrahydrofolate cyclo-ligase